MIDRMNETAEKAFNLFDELLELKGFTHICPVCLGDKEIHPSLQRPEVSFSCPKCNGLGMVKE